MRTNGSPRIFRGKVRDATIRRPGLALCGVLVAIGGLIATSIDASASSSGPTGNVNIVAYSTPAPAYAALIRSFNKTKLGKNVTFTQSYGPSGSQEKAVAAGQPADIVNFSTASDMQKLVPKFVSSGWNANTVTKGMVTDSVVVFVVPKGNPDHITTWADLLKPGVRIFTPNPFSSGSARWNIMAAYGAELKLGKTAAQAKTYLTDLLDRTVVQGSSASNEFQSFLADEHANKGDVFLDYEDDAIQAKRANQPISYVIPKQTILIENPIAITTGSESSPAAKDFLSFLLSTAGQEQWAKLGYRPVLPAVASKTRKLFPHPKQLFTIESLGGWGTVSNTFFGTTTGSLGIVTQIENQLNQAT
jgi:sulfate transport system substrate-binding protein